VACAVALLAGAVPFAFVVFATASTPESALPGRVFVIPVDGTIDLGLAPFVSRVLEAAEAEDRAVVLLDINTFGGRVDAAVLIRDALIESEIHTVAVINPRAISAGALISLACETIAIVPGGTIGAATPIQGGGGEEPEAADEKVMSYMRTEMRATAERRGRRGDIASAMVDPDVAVDGIVEKGKVLTLTSEMALETGIADMEVESLEDTLSQLGLTEAPREVAAINWAERIARFVSEPMISSLLLSLGFLGIMIELYQPGWGIPGTVGALALGIFFFGHHVVMLAGWEELLLLLLGAALIALEILVIPGVGIAGFAGAVLVLAAVLLSLVGLDLRVSWELGFFREALTVMAGALLITTAGGAVVLKVLPGSFLGGRLVLKRTLAGPEPEEDASGPADEEGVALSDLRPAGKVRLGGGRTEAVSEGDFIPAGSRVRVVDRRSGRPVVRLISEEPDPEPELKPEEESEETE
jgi:membrane-bound serine protease (ClpP class)